MSNHKLAREIRIGKIIPIVANIISAFMFFLAYYFARNIWFVVAAIINIVVAVLIYLIFKKFENKYSRFLKKDRQ